MTITNRNLKKAIEDMSNFLINNTRFPEDMVFNFIMELRVSNLLIPVIREDINIRFPHLIGKNASKLLPLFTDKDEFAKYTTEFMALPYEFEYYQYLVNNFNFDGIAVNCEGINFFIDKELINQVPPLTDIEAGGLGKEELRDLAYSVRNEDLVNFIADDANFNRTLGLQEHLKDSVLLNVVICDVDLSAYVNDGIIEREDVGGFVVSKKREGREEYVALYTSLEAARSVEKSDYFKYVQVSNMHEIIRFALTNDFDGIIINPGLEEYYIRRHSLIKMFDDEGLMNPDLASAVDYAFEF